MSKRNKIQQLLITYLRQFGSIDLSLPDGVKLSIGITQEGKHGTFCSDDYCWVTATRDDRATSLDSYNLGMSFAKKDQYFFSDDGDVNCYLEVI